MEGEIMLTSWNRGTPDNICCLTLGNPIYQCFCMISHKLKTKETPKYWSCFNWFFIDCNLLTSDCMENGYWREGNMRNNMESYWILDEHKHQIHEKPPNFVSGFHVLTRVIHSPPFLVVLLDILVSGSCMCCSVRPRETGIEIFRFLFGARELWRRKERW